MGERESKHFVYGYSDDFYIMRDAIHLGVPFVKAQSKRTRTSILVFPLQTIAERHEGMKSFVEENKQ